MNPLESLVSEDWAAYLSWRAGLVGLAVRSDGLRRLQARSAHGPQTPGDVLIAEWCCWERAVRRYEARVFGVAFGMDPHRYLGHLENRVANYYRYFVGQVVRSAQSGDLGLSSWLDLLAWSPGSDAATVASALLEEESVASMGEPFQPSLGDAKGAFVCRGCGGTSFTSDNIQIGSADEGGTTFLHCTNCKMTKVVR